MKTRKMSRGLALLLTLVLVLGILPLTVLAAEAFAYDGEKVNFIKDDGSDFKMLAPQDGTTCVVMGDYVLIHYVPKNTTTYNGIHWGAIDDEELTKDLAFNEDGTFDIKLTKNNCGKALPVAPTKTDGTGTTGTQYYLAIPAESKLADETPASSIEYDGDALAFKTATGDAFGMLAPQDGTTCVINGDNVEIHLVPKNKTVYKGISWGHIYRTELSKDVEVNDDGSFDITLSKEVCGTGVAFAPLKADGGTTGKQYYLCVPVADKLEDVTPEPTVSKFAYEGEEVAFIKASGENFGMFTAQPGTSAKVEDENVVIHFVPKNTTVYNGIHWGAIDDAELTKDVTFNEDGTFDISLPKTECGWALPVAPIKVSDGSTTTTQYFLAIPAEEKLPFEIPTEEPEPQPEPETGVELTVINNVGMFKVVTASFVTGETGSELVFALNGKSYEYLIPGNYEDAIAIGYNKGQWYTYTVNEAGKYEFRVPVAEGQTVIPLVSVSNTYLAGYENGDNTLERSFFPRMLTLDLDAKTLTVDDYSSTTELTVTNETELGVTAASLTTLGGPNSNVYGTTLTLTLSGDYTAAFFGTAEDAAKEGAETVNVTDNTVGLKFRWIGQAGDPSSTVSYLGENVPVSFLTADGWTEYTFNADEKAATLTISGKTAGYTFVDSKDAWKPEDGDLVLTVKCEDADEDANTYDNFDALEIDGKKVDAKNYTLKKGSVIITLKADYLKTLANGKHEIVALFKNGMKATQTVTISGTSNSPKTGDSSDLALYAVLSFASMLLLGAAVATMKKKTER